jgi:hypothetical protein
MIPESSCFLLLKFYNPARAYPLVVYILFSLQT